MNRAIWLSRSYTTWDGYRSDSPMQHNIYKHTNAGNGRPFCFKSCRPSKADNLHDLMRRMRFFQVLPSPPGNAGRPCAVRRFFADAHSAGVGGCFAADETNENGYSCPICQYSNRPVSERRSASLITRERLGPVFDAPSAIVALASVRGADVHRRPFCFKHNRIRSA